MADNIEVKKVVITGGAGFIGSHIADECVKRGWQVIIIDNLSTGRLENIKHLLQITNMCEFVRGSITDLPLLQKVFTGADYVFHEAAVVSVPGSIADPVLAHETNLTGTLKVLLAARDAGVKKLVFASSSAVYGDTPESYKKEDALPKPQSPYAVNKLAGEYYCQVFNEIYKLPTACLRYFNVYGPRQKPDSEYAAVIPKFIQRVKEGKPPIIFGDGEQTRDFIFIKDVVAANILAAESQATGVFNIGTGESTSLNHLSGIITIIMSREDIQAVYEKERPGDIKDSLADIKKARLMGYIPGYTLASGLGEMAGSGEVISVKY